MSEVVRDRKSNPPSKESWEGVITNVDLRKVKGKGEKVKILWVLLPNGPVVVRSVKLKIKCLVLRERSE